MRGFRCWIGVGIAATGLSVGSLAAAEMNGMSSDSRLGEAASIEAVARAFLPEAQWQHQDAEALQAEVRQRLDDDSGSSIFHPDADTGPLTKALLVLMIEEADLPHSRVRLRYARASVAAQGQAPIPVELVEVARFNLGPARREGLIAQHGESRVAPAEDFGDGKHIAWRFIARPIMGQVADITHAARREIPLEGAFCLNAPCSTADSLNEQARDWPAPSPLEPASSSLPLEVALLEVGLERLGLVQRDDSGPARWHPPEWPESVLPGDAFLEVLVERGLGQDDGVDLVIYLDHLMDDDIKALWQRLMAVDTGAGEPPRVWETQDREPWPRPDW